MPVVLYISLYCVWISFHLCHCRALFFLLRMNLELFSAVIANSFKRSVRAPFDPTPKLEAQNALDHFEQIPNSLMGMDQIDV